MPKSKVAFQDTYKWTSEKAERRQMVCLARDGYTNFEYFCVSRSNYSSWRRIQSWNKGNTDLRLELALIVDVGANVVKLCYQQEGDGYLTNLTKASQKYQRRRKVSIPE